MRTTPTLPLFALTLALGVTGACTPYARYPYVQGDTAATDLDLLPSPIVMRLALARVASRHLDGARPYAIALPDAATDETTRRIADELGPDALVATDAPAGVPVIRVTRVWLLGDRALVDVERPVADARQALTVRLRSSIEGWRVTGVRSWPVGLALTPGDIDDTPPTDAPPADMPPTEFEFDNVPPADTPPDDAFPPADDEPM